MSDKPRQSTPAPQLSPHTGCASNLLNALASETALSKAVMSGVSRCSGMFGISS